MAKAEPVEIAPEHRVVLIRVTWRFAEVRTPEDLYEVTREWWKVAPDRHQPDYAFSIHNGIVRGVYRIDTWEREERDGHELYGRWRFSGERDDAMEELYLCKDVTGYLPRGAQNPIKYVNC